MENAGLHRRLVVFILKGGFTPPFPDQATVVGASIITPETGGKKFLSSRSSILGLLPELTTCRQSPNAAPDVIKNIQRLATGVLATG